MSTYSSYGDETHVGLKLFAVFAGVLVPIVMGIGLWLAISAANARDDAQKAAATAKSSATSMSGMSTATGTGYATPSYAGEAPATAETLAMSHTAAPAALPAAPTGDVAVVPLDITHSTISIAPGIRYEAWTFGGTVPGPVIHVR